MISIIVPVYNVKDYLVRCLESLYAQTYKDYEVIVVDDGSSDESGKIAEEYCRDKPNFHVYHKTNGGLMSAWKYGLEKSKGNYIGFVDSDDYIASTMYEELVNAGFKYDAEIVLCNHYYVNENGTSKILHRNPIKEGFYTGEKLDIIKRKTLPLIGQDYISPSRCNKLIKKNLLQSCLKYTDSRISSAEDVNTIVPCVLKCERFYYVDKALYYYVKRETSISHIFKNHILDTYEILISNLLQCVRDFGLEEKLKSETLGLRNFYGVLWSIYVANSTLRLRKKISQLKRLTADKAYKTSSALISRQDGKMAYAYKLMIRFKMYFLFLFANHLLNLKKKRAAG